MRGIFRFRRSGGFLKWLIDFFVSLTQSWSDMSCACHLKVVAVPQCKLNGDKLSHMQFLSCEENLVENKVLQLLSCNPYQASSSLRSALKKMC